MGWKAPMGRRAIWAGGPMGGVAYLLYAAAAVGHNCGKRESTCARFAPTPYTTFSTVRIFIIAGAAATASNS